MIDWILDSGGAVALIVVLLIGAVVWVANKDEQEWQVYAQSHHCRQTGKIESSTDVIAGGKGGLLIVPSKAIYTCDGGETVIR